MKIYLLVFTIAFIFAAFLGYETFAGENVICNNNVDDLIKSKFSNFLNDHDTNLTIRILPWETLKDNIDYFWSQESNQRYGGRISLKQALLALDDFEILKDKISDSDDPLIDLARYRHLLAISGFSGKLYWMIEKLYWKREFSRAKEGFEYLLLPENKDLFTVGASHFYLGRMALELPLDECWYPDEVTKNEDALNHLLLVQRYPTCLTYISYSYIFAASLYNQMNFPLHANALVMVDVPSIDWKFMKFKKHLDGSEYCFISRDTTNYIRHIVESIRYCDKGADYVKRRIRKLSYSDELWNCCATNFFTRFDLANAIDKAMHCNDSAPQEELFYEAVTHPWPDIKSIPEAIATNRVLNNNVFSY